jgi:hypothetical protein
MSSTATTATKPATRDEMQKAWQRFQETEAEADLAMKAHNDARVHLARLLGVDGGYFKAATEAKAKSLAADGARKARGDDTICGSVLAFLQSAGKKCSTKEIANGTRLPRRQVQNSMKSLLRRSLVKSHWPYNCPIGVTYSAT